MEADVQRNRRAVVARKVTFTVGLLAFGAVVVAGCRPAGSVPTVPASGRLVYAGRPLAGIDVVFTPAHGRRGFATTDADGRFSISTFARGDGAVPGRHRVTLWPHAQANAVIADSYAARATVNSEASAKILPFPKRYTSTGDSPLVVDLDDRGSRSLELTLEDGP